MTATGTAYAGWPTGVARCPGGRCHHRFAECGRHGPRGPPAGGVAVRACHGCRSLVHLRQVRSGEHVVSVHRYRPKAWCDMRGYPRHVQR